MPPRKLLLDPLARMQNAIERMSPGTIKGRMQSAAPVPPGRSTAGSSPGGAVASAVSPATYEFICNISRLDATGHVIAPLIAYVEPPMYPPWDGTLVGARLWTTSDVLPTSDVIVDVEQNGTSIFGASPPTIPAGQAFGTAIGITAPFVADDKLQVDVLSPGGVNVICLILDYQRD